LSKSNEILTAKASRNVVQTLLIFENRGRDTPLQGVYIPHFDQISVKVLVLGSYTLIVAPIGRNFTPIGATCRPCGAKKPQNRPLSNLNKRRFALRSMLPVNKAIRSKHNF